MKLFISYRRAAWSFTYWLAEELGKLIDAEIFVDYSGIDEANFETALLRNLRESDAVLLIVTDHTFASDRIHQDSDWVRREIREALSLQKPIVLALHNGLLPPADLPDDIQDIRKAQGIEFYPRYFKAGVYELATFLDRATPIKLHEIVPFLDSPDGRYRAIQMAQEADVHYEVIEIATGQTVLTTSAQYPTPNDVKVGEFGPDSKKFASAYHYEHTKNYSWIGVWSTESGEFLYSKMRPGWITSLAGIFDE